MTLAKRLGLGNKKDGGIHLTVGEVTLPLDLALELLLRQQSQLFSFLNNIGTRIDVGEQVVSEMGEHFAHLHNDWVELKQALEHAGRHPVEKVDEQTEARERGEEKEKVH